MLFFPVVWQPCSQHKKKSYLRKKSPKAHQKSKSAFGLSSGKLVELSSLPTDLHVTWPDKEEPSTDQAQLNSVNLGQSYLKNKQCIMSWGALYFQLWFPFFLTIKCLGQSSRRICSFTGNGAEFWLFFWLTWYWVRKEETDEVHCRSGHRSCAFFGCKKFRTISHFVSPSRFFCVFSFSSVCWYLKTNYFSGNCFTFFSVFIIQWTKW